MTFLGVLDLRRAHSVLAEQHPEDRFGVVVMWLQLVGPDREPTRITNDLLSTITLGAENRSRMAIPPIYESRSWIIKVNFTGFVEYYEFSKRRSVPPERVVVFA